MPNPERNSRSLGPKRSNAVRSSARPRRSPEVPPACQGDEQMNALLRLPDHPRIPPALPMPSPSNHMPYDYLTLSTDGCQIAVNDWYLPISPQVPIHNDDMACSCVEDGYAVAAIQLIHYPAFALRVWQINDVHAKQIFEKHIRSWGATALDKVQERLGGNLDIGMIRAVQQVLREKAKDFIGADGAQVRRWAYEDDVSTQVREMECQKEGTSGDLQTVAQRFAKLFSND